ncbi:MAG: MBL fold metallo-hydrolase [Euryarchaeota archaeon]|nr:MBL fold metallo-hydrolase [Euryarchaeota archaeon]
MEGDALTVRIGNGIEVTGENLGCHLDPRSLSSKDMLPNGVFCTSHAHSDHIPTKYERKGENRVMSTEFTRRFISEVKGKELLPQEHPNVTMHNAGHVTGSVMFEIDVGKKVLYTGDFCTRDRFRIEGARPRKVDYLIMESTYGRPEYVFPPTEGMLKVMKDWIEDSLAQNFSVVLFTSSNLGKTHELIHALKDFGPHVHGTISGTSRILQKCGLELDYLEDDHCGSDDPFVLIGANNQRAMADIMQSHKGVRRMRKASVTGWVVGTRDVGRSRRYGMDEAFAISDHSDYNELLEFVRKCSPEKVFLEHGYSVEMAESIRRELGIEACPVPNPKGQQSLMNY